MKIVDSVVLSLPSGDEVELSMTQEFLLQIKNTFSLSSTRDITKNHIREFLVNSMKNALEQSDGKNESN